MYSAHDTLAGGLPHSDIHGSTPARGSPWLFAACHVLHRLLVPRHPPNALLILTTKHDTEVMPFAHHAQKPSTPKDWELRSCTSKPLLFLTEQLCDSLSAAQYSAHTCKDQHPSRSAATCDASERSCRQAAWQVSIPYEIAPYRSDIATDDAPRDAPEPDSH